MVPDLAARHDRGMDVRIVLVGDLEHERDAVRFRVLSALSRFDGVLGRVTLTLSYEASAGRTDARGGCVARIRAASATGSIGYQHFGLDAGDAVQSVLARAVRALERALANRPASLAGGSNHAMRRSS